jgi:hypothetical protein
MKLGWKLCQQIKYSFEEFLFLALRRVPMDGTVPAVPQFLSNKFLIF